MTKRLIMVFTLLVITTLHQSANAAITVANETQLHQYLDLFANGQITPKDCLDPNLSNYFDHCYLEISQSFTLTKPVSIPGYVHLVGGVENDRPTLKFAYDIASYPVGSDRCLMSFDGDSVALENVVIDARNHFSDLTFASVHDSAICMKGNNGLVKNVAITTPTGSNVFTLIQAITDGITISGNDNIVYNNNITLKFGDGLIVNGKSNTIRDNTVSTFGYGIRLNAGDKNFVARNNITGKVAVLFELAAQIPIGQATNILLDNTLNDTDQKDATTNPLAYVVVYKEKLPLPDCGICNDITGPVKVGYNNDGTCKIIPKSGACEEFFGSFQTIQEAFYTVGNSSAGSTSTTSDTLINENVPQPDGDGSMSGTVPATPETSTPQTAPSAATGSGGCSLIRE